MPQSRRDLIRAYKERTPERGIFAVRCAASGEAWVGATDNLDTQQNGIWFALRVGGFPNPAVVRAWAAHGAESFAFEILERVDEPDMTPMGVRDHLKRREAHWREALGAGKLTG
jgi:hypothetical protein